jgi:glycosyltransferase involved in cell wall biosynthesis
VPDNLLVSVYMPTRNRETLLRRAVESVLGQSYAALELIVVNDASTDGTRDYLEQLAKDDGRVTVLHMASPSGAPAARNRAILAAKGDFVTGIDDDDEFENDRIEAFVAEWGKVVGAGENVSCLFSESMHHDGVRTIRVHGRKDEVTYADLFEYNYIGNQVFSPRRHFQAIGGFDERMKAWQDLETFMRLTQKFGVGRLVRKPTYVWHIEADRERISRKPELLRSAYERIVEKHADAPEELKRRLFFQMFSPFYGTIPIKRDWLRVLGWLDPAEAARLLHAAVRNSLARWT